VNGGPLADDLSHAVWNGKDCNGDSVACGKYQIEFVYQGQHISEDITVAGPGAVMKHDQSSCDSLRKVCTGFIYEEKTPQGYACVCCQ
jgi:hypothetical protein